MIQPVNGFLLIAPVKQSSFVQAGGEVFDEIGEVLAKAEGVDFVEVGSKVYFDSFMARKYPDAEDITKFFWLVHKDEIAAVV